MCVFVLCVCVTQTKEEEKKALQKHEAEIMDTIKEVVKTGKREIRARPAMVIENREPPEIPEMSLGEMGNSPYVGKDAVKYLIRLALQNYQGKLTRAEEREGMEEKEEEEGKTSTQQGRERETSGATKSEENGKIPSGEGAGDVGKEGERKESQETSAGDGIAGEKKEGLTESGKVEKAKKKKKIKKKKKVKAVRKLSRAAEAIRRAKLEELDRETRQIIKEAAEALNRNQTPVLRRSSPKIYNLPRDDDPVVLPASPELDSTRTRVRRGSTKPATLNTDEQKDKKASVPGRMVAQSEDQSSSTKSALTEKVSTSTEPTAPTKDESSSTEPTVPERSEAETEEQEANQSPSSRHNDVGRSSSPRARKKPSSKFAKQPNVPLHKMRKTREQIREEESRRRFPERRPWPTLEECEETPVPKSVVFTSTWLSVTAKGIKCVHIP